MYYVAGFELGISVSVYNSMSTLVSVHFRFYSGEMSNNNLHLFLLARVRVFRQVSVADARADRSFPGTEF